MFVDRKWCECVNWVLFGVLASKEIDWRWWQDNEQKLHASWAVMLWWHSPLIRLYIEWKKKKICVSQMTRLIWLAYLIPAAFYWSSIICRFKNTLTEKRFFIFFVVASFLFASQQYTNSTERLIWIRFQIPTRHTIYTHEFIVYIAYTHLNDKQTDEKKKKQWENYHTTTNHVTDRSPCTHTQLQYEL